ncbi:hypothetical protein AALP_AA8G414700 [Arabis alpina]|uniref:Uncharacterized protein n=1 Tax=Arabis alpina TaxID=50452 RepID=A0A087GCS7_ARAAL|nr:hypothetical protein AALP_AA8G414700 [Arabis alpina]
MIVLPSPSATQTILTDRLNHFVNGFLFCQTKIPLVLGISRRPPVTISVDLLRHQTQSPPSEPPDLPDPPNSLSLIQLISGSYIRTHPNLHLPQDSTNMSCASSSPLTGGKLHHRRFIPVSPVDLSGTRSRGIDRIPYACFPHLHPRVSAPHNSPLDDDRIISTDEGSPIQRCPTLMVVSGPAWLSSPENIIYRPLLRLYSSNLYVREMMIMGPYICEVLMGLSMAFSLLSSLDLKFKVFWILKSCTFLLLGENPLTSPLVESKIFLGFKTRHFPYG